MRVCGGKKRDFLLFKTRRVCYHPDNGDGKDQLGILLVGPNGEINANAHTSE